MVRPNHLLLMRKPPGRSLAVMNLRKPSGGQAWSARHRNGAAHQRDEILTATPPQRAPPLLYAARRRVNHACGGACHVCDGQRRPMALTRQHIGYRLPALRTPTANVPRRRLPIAYLLTATTISPTHRPPSRLRRAAVRAWQSKPPNVNPHRGKLARGRTKRSVTMGADTMWRILRSAPNGESA